MGDNLNMSMLYAIAAKCPVTHCQREFTALELMAHLCLHHHPHASMLEVRADWPVLFRLDVTKLKTGCSHVIGAIAYSGHMRYVSSRPATAELQLWNHLPIILMVYVLPKLGATPEKYVFYMVTSRLSHTVSATLTLLDGSKTHERRGLYSQLNLIGAAPPYSADLLYCGHDYAAFPALIVQELYQLGNCQDLMVKIVLHGEPDMLESAPLDT